jgi:hypothetical protein
MRILDENDQEVVDPDLDLGHLEPDKLFIAHHEEIPEKLPVKKIDYDNPYYVGSNGGKLVNTIEVSPYQPYEPAWDEYEDILRYILYTEEELAEIEAQKKAEEEAQKEAEEQEVERQIQAQMRTAAMFSVMTMALTDDQAMEVSTLIEEWSVGGTYKTGDIRRYNGYLYRALQDSTGEEQYPPDQFVAGWKRVGEPNEKGIYPYVQPLGATDAYNTGDKVTYKGETYESTIDGNVWPPDVYPAGWKLVENDPEPEPEPEETPEWVQPTGAHDAYAKDAVVMHNGKKWKSDIDGNVWEPGVYGWTEVSE